MTTSRRRQQGFLRGCTAGWERRGSQIVKTFAGADFAHAMMFVDEVATAAEAAGHHPDPDINIRWNQITLALSSHAEGGLTERDFQLAARIPELDRPPAPPDHRLDWICRGWPGGTGCGSPAGPRLGTASDHRVVIGH